MLHYLRYSTHSFPIIPESVFYDATTISKMEVIYSSNHICFGNISTFRLAINCRVALRWHFHCCCPISKPIPVLDFLAKKQGSFFFFQNNNKLSLYDEEKVFLVILANNWWFSENGSMLASSHLTRIKLVCGHGLENFSRNHSFVLCT